MEWEDIDNMFKDYERLCRQLPTDEELVGSIMEALEVFRELYPEFDRELKDN